MNVARRRRRSGDLSRLKKSCGGLERSCHDDKVSDVRVCSSDNAKLSSNNQRRDFVSLSKIRSDKF